MRRLSKVICIALSMMLLVNLTGFDAVASEPDTESQTGGGKAEDTSSDTEDKTDKGDETGGDVTDDKNGNTDGTPDAVNPGENKSQNDPVSDDAAASDEAGSLDAQEPGQDAAADEADNELDKQDVAGISAESVSGANQLKISWSKVDGATGYNVTVTQDGQISGKVYPINSGTTLETEVDVTPNVRYSIKVESTGDSSQSGEIPAILLTAPANLKATPSNGTVRLSWTALAGATYDVKRNGDAVKSGLTTGNCDVTGLTNGQSYNFSVTAHVKYTDNGKEYSYESVSAATVSAAPMGDKPAQVTGLSGIDGEKSAILTWSKAAYADSYAIYRYNTSKKTWDVVKNGVTQLTYTDNKLTAGKKYQYRVAGVNENGTGALSAAITISVKKTPGTKVRSIGYKATVKSRAPLFATSKSSKRLRYLKKGTKVTTTDYARGRYEIKVGGKIYWISKDRLKFRASVWTTKDYSTKVKEDFVNKRGYKSPTKYLIWISQYTQRVIIYQGSKGKWKMIRNCRCATGTHLHMTPKGVFKVGKKEKGWFYKKTFEKPIVHFKSQNSFHSRIKNYKGGYADATIGRPRSKGCVRLYDEDINFIYKKCPKGTTVVSL